MALSKNDERIIKDIFQRENKPNADLLLVVKTLLFGEGENTGMIGKQKKHDEEIDLLKNAVVAISDSVKTMKTLAYILSVAILGGIVTIVVRLLMHSNGIP